MKDTLQSTCTVIMSNSSQALGACVSPTSTPSKNPWFKRTSNHHFTGSHQRDKMTPADWDHPAKDAGVIRIGDAPSDTQGATEPEGVATPNVSTVALDFQEEKPSCGMMSKHVVTRPMHSTLAQCSTLSKEDSGSAIPPQSSKPMPRFHWRSDVTKTVGLGRGDLSVGRILASHPLHSPSNEKCNREQASPKTERKINSIQDSLFPYPNHLLPGSSAGITRGPWKTEWDNAVQNQRKPSNLSEIERQRGPLKKRHINYQPDVLDLSTKSKRAKAETESRGGLVNSVIEGSSNCDNAQTLQNERVILAQKLFQERLSLSLKQEQTQSGNLNEASRSCGRVHPSHSERVIYAQELFQERLNTALKQEQAQSVNEEVGRTGIPASVAGQRVLPTNDVTDRKQYLAGVPNSDQKQGLTEPSVSFRSNQLSNQPINQRLATTNVSNSYPSGSLLVPVLQNTELVRQWVLHVTKRNEMFTMQQLQAKLTPDSDSNHSSTSDVSRQGSMPSSPTFKNPGRRLLSVNAAVKMEKPYACEHCSSTFKHRHHVIRHMRAHNGERPFHCEHCGATFARKCVLTNHRRTHTGEKPYICAECGDTFSRKHHLVIHQRTHSGEKPYRCLDCGAAFARSHHVNRHRKTHEKEQEVDAHIELLRSTQNDTNNQLSTMVPLTSQDMLSSPEMAVTPNPERAMSLPKENNTPVELVTNSTEQNTQIVKVSNIQTSVTK